MIRTLQRIRKRVLLSRLLKSGSVDLTVSLSIFAILLLVDRLPTGPAQANPGTGRVYRGTHNSRAAFTRGRHLDVA